MPETRSANVRLVEALEKLQAHDHPCLIYKGRAEMVAVVAPFVKKGFERGERCLVFIPDANRRAFLDDLVLAGIDTAAALTGGALFIPDVHRIYGRDEPFNADRVLDYLDRAISEAKASGYAGLRLVGDMPWTLEGTTGPESLIEYEAKLNDFMRHHDLPALCLYDSSIFPPDVLLDVLRTHPKAIVRQVVSSSHSYLPPHEFFNTDRASVEMNNLLHGMLSNEELISAMEERITLLNAVIENSPDIIYVKDLDGRYLMINPAGAAFFGRPVEEVLGRTVDEFLSAEDAAAVMAADKQAFATGQPLSIELNYTLAGVTHTFLVIKGIYRQKGKVTGLFGISRDITERKRAEAEIMNCQQELRFLTSEMSRKEEQERQTIASELHDKIGQTLALAKIRLELLDGGDESRTEARRISELLDSAIRHTRSLTLELSPPVLYELGFEAAVESLCEEFQSQYGIEVDFRDDRTAKPLSDALRALLYRGVRELLVNIVKHARASRASVAIEKDGAFIRITVEDNGIGFDSSKSRRISRSNGGFGLFSIRERLAYLDGKLNIESTMDTGTRMTLIAPLQVDAAAPASQVLRFHGGSRRNS